MPKIPRNLEMIFPRSEPLVDWLCFNARTKMGHGVIIDKEFCHSLRRTVPSPRTSWSRQIRMLRAMTTVYSAIPWPRMSPSTDLAYKAAGSCSAIDTIAQARTNAQMEPLLESFIAPTFNLTRGTLITLKFPTFISVV